jgi:hypothetical protein
MLLQYTLKPRVHTLYFSIDINLSDAGVDILELGKNSTSSVSSSSSLSMSVTDATTEQLLLCRTNLDLQMLSVESPALRWGYTAGAPLLKHVRQKGDTGP